MIYNRLTKSQKIYFVKELLGIDFSDVEAVRFELMFKTVTLDSFRTLNDIIRLKADIEATKAMARTKNNMIDFYETIGSLPCKIEKEKANNDFSVLPPKPKRKHNLRIV